MAKEKSGQTSVNGFSMGDQDGYLAVLRWEQERFESSEKRFGSQFISYSVQESPKGREVTVVVNVGPRDTARKAEWAGVMAVKSRHASLYDHQSMAFETPDGWQVHVRWMLWKPQEQTGGINF